MTTELSKNLMAIVLRNGIEIWAEEEKIKNLQRILTIGKESKFIELEGESFNTADIIGIFSAHTMSDMTRRKNGQWKCRWGHWHDRGEKCFHKDPLKEEERKKYEEEFYNDNGYYPANNSSGGIEKEETTEPQRIRNIIDKTAENLKAKGII